MIQASFAPATTGAGRSAPGPGWPASSTAIGPFVGGWLIDYASWRWIFLINVPLAVAVLLVALRGCRRAARRGARPPAARFDIAGAAARRARRWPA